MNTGLEVLEVANEIEVLHFYGGTIKLQYDKKLHEYCVVENGVRHLVPGATTVTGIYDKSGPLTQWAANMTSQYLRNKLAARFNIPALTDLPWDTAAEPVLIQLPSNEVEVLLNEARFNFRNIKEDAADVGHIAHAWLEGYFQSQIAGRYYVAPLPTEERAASCVQAALKWLDTHNVRPVYAERKIYSREFGYGGTFDYLAYVTGCGNPECCFFTGERLELGDYKSSNRIYEEYRMQTAAYVHAHMEEFPDHIESRRILRLGKEDGAFESFNIPPEDQETDFDGFLGLLQAYNWRKQLDLNKKYVKEQDKAAARAAKAAEEAAKPKKRRAPRKPVIKELATKTLIPVGV